MSRTDTTFFTNEDGKTLNQRFNILLKDTQFFDALVGYFRISGFYLLQESLEKVDEIRILVGLNTDEKTVDFIEEANGATKQLSFTNSSVPEEYSKKIIDEFDNSEDSMDSENGINKFVEMLKSEKIKMRVYKKEPIHAKLYIMRDRNPEKDFGRVITGSSNFSQSGLSSNIEFNVELKNSADVEYALESFEKLWEESVPIEKDCIDTIENKTWIKNDITPYEMYVKFLYEYFKEEINSDLDEDDNSFYPENFKPLQYQKDAVTQALRIIEKHNGVFISDVVGLGKTYMCSMIAQKQPKKKLFICSPVLIDYWKDTLRDFGVQGAKVVSIGKLKELANENLSSYGYVYIDESHNFKNSGTERYSYLKQICVGKKVVLISATPQNNYISDIESQLYLFEKAHNSSLVNAKNLENFFSKLKTKEKNSRGDKDYHKEVIKECAATIRDKVLRDVMIRRTRSEISRVYKDDMKKQGITFPEVSDPIKLAYEFSEETSKAFDSSVKAIGQMTYARYKPLVYLKDGLLDSKQNSLVIGQENMGGFMKAILVKRLESSRYAFMKSLRRFIVSYENVIRMYDEKGIVAFSKKVDLSEYIDAPDFLDVLEQFDDDKQVEYYKKEQFNPSFIKHLKFDLELLKSMEDEWSKITKDDKFEKFASELKERKELKENKIIVFTESKETAEYLNDELIKRNEKVMYFAGSMKDSLRQDIKNNFDANVDLDKQVDDYRILIATDVLAEGMNLHRSNVIINYDLPWNPTRIMQRVGRINRVGTKFKKIFVCNFFPTEKSKEHLTLEDNIKNKLEMFQTMLGTDMKYLTEEEEVGTYEIFKAMTSYKEDEEEMSELAYLKIIRDIRDNDKELFERITKYPKKIKIARKNDNDSLITFFRKGYVKEFFENINGETKEITFEEAVKKLHADKKEKSISVDNKYYDMLKENKKAFAQYEQGVVDSEEVTAKTQKKNALNIKKLLKECLRIEGTFTELDIKKIEATISLLDEGMLPDKILKDGSKLMASVSGKNDYAKFYKAFTNKINDSYYENYKKEKAIEKIEENEKKEIILSERFIV